jgi:hypothetical protein
MSMPNIKVTSAKFVHPSEFGLNYPINTPAELYAQTSALNRALARGSNLVGVIKDGKYQNVEKEKGNKQVP